LNAFYILFFRRKVNFFWLFWCFCNLLWCSNRLLLQLSSFTHRINILWKEDSLRNNWCLWLMNNHLLLFCWFITIFIGTFRSKLLIKDISRGAIIFSRKCLTSFVFRSITRLGKLTCFNFQVFNSQMDWIWNPFFSLYFLWNYWFFTAISSYFLDTCSIFTSINFLCCLRWLLRSAFKFIRLWYC